MALNLPRFNARTSLVDFSGVPSFAFHRWWDEIAKNIEVNYSDLATAVADIAAAQAAADAAQTAANTAQTTANTAQTTATTAQTTADASAHTADWSGVTDDNGGKPSDNATVGADWASNLTSRPTELTDGRVAAGLNASGGIDFAGAAHTNKDMDNIADGATYVRIPSVNTTGTGTSRRALINFAQAHVNKSLSNVDSAASTKLSGIEAGATAGATWGTNVNSRPTELTDGRISTALNSSGVLQTAITSTLANTSNLLRRTSGGLYTGDLAATLGADLSSNVTNVTPRYLPAQTAAGGRYKFTGGIAYTSTATVATISVGAGSLYVGNTTVSYNSMSVDVTSSGTYFLYVQTNPFTAGAHTLLATTNGDLVYQNDNNVYIGNIAVVVSSGGTGGGTGGGGFGDCPWEEAFVHCTRGWVKAKDVVPGDELITLNLTRDGLDTTEVESNEPATEECFVITSASGYRVTVSESTPVVLKDGSIIRPKDIKGHELPVEAKGGVQWEPCEVSPIGRLPVRRIRCHQKCYSAGDILGFGILTHNPKP